MTKSYFSPNTNEYLGKEAQKQEAFELAESVISDTARHHRDVSLYNGNLLKLYNSLAIV